MSSRSFHSNSRCNSRKIKTTGGISTSDSIDLIITFSEKSNTSKHSVKVTARQIFASTLIRVVSF